MKTYILKFLFPKVDSTLLLRVVVTAVLTYIFFAHIFIIARVDGKSMEPTIHNRTIVMGFRLRYKFKQATYGDIVILPKSSMSRNGRDVQSYYLKRVIGLEGDVLEFRRITPPETPKEDIRSALFRNGELIEEPYVKYSWNWNYIYKDKNGKKVKTTTVKPGMGYYLGDNRFVPVGDHLFGQNYLDHIKGNVFTAKQSILAGILSLIAIFTLQSIIVKLITKHFFKPNDDSKENESE